MESVTSVIKRVTWLVTAPMQKATEVVVVEVGCHSLSSDRCQYSLYNIS